MWLTHVNIPDFGHKLIIEYKNKPEINEDTKITIVINSNTCNIKRNHETETSE